MNQFIYVTSEKNVDGAFVRGDVLSVSREEGVVNQIEFQGRSFAGADVSVYGILRHGDIVYTKSPLRANPYGIIKTNKGRSGIVSTLYATYRARPGVDSDFIQCYFDQDARLNNYLHPLVNKGAKNDMKVSAENAITGNVCFPGCEEQRLISSLFDRLDNLITLHQRKCEYRSLCGYLSWEQRKFSDIADVCSGKDYKHLKEGPIPVYGTGGFMTSVDEALSYDRDAVGIGRKGTIDKPYLLKAPFWTVDTLFYAIPKEDMDLEFVHCSFLNVDWKSKDESTGLPSLSKEAINETIALVPSFNEQSRLGEFFNNLDSLITLHQ